MTTVPHHPTEIPCPSCHPAPRCSGRCFDGDYRHKMNQLLTAEDDMTDDRNHLDAWLMTTKSSISSRKAKRSAVRGVK